MQNLRRVGENSGPISSRLWMKVMKFSGDVGDPCSLQRTCPLMYFMFHSEDIGR